MAVDDVATRLAGVRARMAAACERVGRLPRDVTLVAVSKTHPPEAIRAAYQAGQREFGENYAQELVAKHAALSDLQDLRWHFIGHLQRNKAADVVATGAFVETVDSLRLGEAIARRAEQSGRRVKVLIEVNVGEEGQKAGVSRAEVAALVTALEAMPSLELRGLMCIPPAADDPQAMRPYFRTLRSLVDEHGLAECSMGMSSDFEIAIEEGATCVRVGTAIFGERVRPSASPAG